MSCECFSEATLTRRIHRVAKPLHDRVDIRGGDDVGRRDDDVVALLAVDRAAHRIGGKAAGDALRFDALVQLQCRVEHLLRSPVGDEFKRPEQPAPPDVADMTVVAEPLLQRRSPAGGPWPGRWRAGCRRG